MIDTRIRILWDTNVFVQALLFGQEQLIDYLDKLILQQQNNLINLVIPKAVQAEFYGVMRAGRLDLDIDGVKHKKVQLTHNQIAFLLEPYFDTVFNPDFIRSLNQLDWPLGIAYKDVLHQIIITEYNWHDLGKSVIERRLGKSVEYLGLNDPFDYPIMAAALVQGVELIVTANMQDFSDPLGSIRIMKSHDACKFDHFSLQINPSSYNPPI
ncbi:MAG: hypothetical protein WDZ91_00680 [Paenibacillaceae bacterium]